MFFCIGSGNESNAFLILEAGLILWLKLHANILCGIGESCCEMHLMRLKLYVIDLNMYEIHPCLALNEG